MLDANAVLNGHALVIHTKLGRTQIPKPIDSLEARVEPGPAGGCAGLGQTLNFSKQRIFPKFQGLGGYAVPTHLMS